MMGLRDVMLKYFLFEIVRSHLEKNQWNAWGLKNRKESGFMDVVQYLTGSA
jgi:hypothetical protein